MLIVAHGNKADKSCVGKWCGVSPPPLTLLLYVKSLPALFQSKLRTLSVPLKLRQALMVKPSDEYALQVQLVSNFSMSMLAHRTRV